jgi:hypothetical protein
MFGKAFGKRVADVSSSGPAYNYIPVKPDQDGEMRIVPKAVWDGPNGDMLRQYGFLPDNPKNLALTPERMHAMADAAHERMNAIVAKVNAHIPGVSVIPWAMIPWSVWQDQNAEFLMKMDFFQSSPWNNMLLPADAASSDYLGLPQHPRIAQPGLDEELSRLITELRIETADKIASFMPAFVRGDISFLDEFTEFSNDRFRKLMALTRYVAYDIFGKEACIRHDELFGFGLSEITD